MCLRRRVHPSILAEMRSSGPSFLKQQLQVVEQLRPHGCSWTFLALTRGLSLRDRSLLRREETGRTN